MEYFRDHPKRKAIIAATIAAAGAMLFATFARADGPSPSIYFGVHGGKSFANTEVTADMAPGMSLDGLGAHGYIGGVHLGADLAFTKNDGLNPFVGVFCGYSWQNTAFELTLGPGASLTAELGNSYYGGVRLGLTSPGGVKGYVLGAYRQTDIAIALSGLTPSPGPSSLKGWDIGIGGEMPLAKHVSIGVEGVWTRYDKEDVTWNGSDTGLNIQPDQLSVMARLNVTLGGLQSMVDDSNPPAGKACDPKMANCKKR